LLWKLKYNDQRQLFDCYCRRDRSRRGADAGGVEERAFPVGELRLLASERSAGQYLEFGSRRLRVELLREDVFDDVDIALFSAGRAVSEKFVPLAVDAGSVVIDNSPQFRMDADVPLVVPEVNAEEIARYRERGIITQLFDDPVGGGIQTVHDVGRILQWFRRINRFRAREDGHGGIEPAGDPPSSTAAICAAKFPPIASTVSRIDAFLDNGYTKEEMKIIQETQKFSATLRYSYRHGSSRSFFCGHSESVNVKRKKTPPLRSSRC
jgi:aspartate-semialdehyde dehydrogenase